MWRTERKEIDEFIALANKHHPSIKFTAEISDKKVNFLDTTVNKGEIFHNQGILDIRTHFKPTVRLFNIRISLPATLTRSVKVS